MAIRGLRTMTAGRSVAGQTDRESTTLIDEKYLLEIINLRQSEPGVWETRAGFTKLSALTSPTGEKYTSQFDYQSTDFGGIRRHLGVVGKTIVVDGAGNYNLSSSARGHWIQWTINNVCYYVNGTDVVRYDGQNFRTPGFAGPGTTSMTGSASGSGSLTAGNYRFRVTFVGDVTESSPSEPTAAIVSAGSDGIDLSSIPTGPSGTTSRNIYRTRSGGTTGADYFFDQTIGDNTTTTARSTQADSSLGDRAEFDNNNMGAIIGAKNNPTDFEIYNDHLFVWGHLTDRLNFSKLANPESFGTDDYIDFPGKKGDVTGGIIKCVNYLGKLYIFRRDTIHFLSGNNRDDFITSINSYNFGPIGAIAPDSFQIIDGLIYFLAEDGPYVFNGAGTPRFIGGNVPSVFDPYHQHAKLNSTQLNLVQSVYYRPKKQWWLAVPERNQTSLSAVYVYQHQYRTAAPDSGISVGQWSKYESTLFPISSIEIIEGTSGNVIDIDRVLFSDNSGNIYEHETSETDNGTAISWRWTTTAIDFDAPYLDKRWMYFTPFIHEAQWGSTMIVEFLFDESGLRKKLYSYDLGSEIDASALWGQMLWDDQKGYWNIQSRTMITPILINDTSKILHVMMRGSTRIKVEGFQMAAVFKTQRDSQGKGTIKDRIRV